MSRLFIRASRIFRLSSRSLTKVRQIEILNGKRFQLIAVAVRLTPSDLIAGIIVPYLIPFIVKIPRSRKLFFLMARSYPNQGHFRRSSSFPVGTREESSFSQREKIFRRADKAIKRCGYRVKILKFEF